MDAPEPESGDGKTTDSNGTDTDDSSEETTTEVRSEEPTAEVESGATATEGESEAPPQGTDTGSEGDASPATDDPSADESDDSGSTDVETIKGVGPTYADRLSEAGVGTVEQLADADPAALAEDTGISETRLSNWIEQANVR